MRFFPVLRMELLIVFRIKSLPMPLGYKARKHKMKIIKSGSRPTKKASSAWFTGTVWQDVLDFRREMLDQRPDIDFYISSTTSLINVLHVPDFHRSWTEKGLIKPEQFRIQTLHWPEWMRVETAPPALRVQIREKINNHLEWLRPLDNEGRATQGFESILTQLDTTIAFDSKDFWQNILPLDKYYKANLLDSFPELVDLPK